MRSQVRIFLPCDVFTVRVKFGSGSEVTELEHLLLRAVRSGEHSISALRDLFGLTERMIHDVLFDLWKIGYLVISFDRGEIFLAGEAADWGDGKAELSRLASLEAEDTRQLMIDRFVGHIYPLSGESASPNPYFVTPDVLGRAPFAEATTQKLISALGRVVASESRFGGAAKQILSAYIPFNQNEVTGGRRWYGVDVITSIAADTSRFAVHVVTTRNLPPGVRHSIERELCRLVTERPDHDLSKALLDHARGNRWRPREPKKALATLEQQLATISIVDLNDCLTLDQALRVKAGDLAAEIEERRIAEANIQIVVGSQQHDEVVRDLIRTARHQIVISSPYVSERGLGKLREPLSSRMGEGVRVFVMWGLASVDADEGHLALSTQTRDIVNGLQARFPDQFFWSYLPSRTHAKLVVQDDQRALITSLNVLDPSHPSVIEVGSLIKAHSDKGRPAIVSDLLSWARRTYPIFQDSRAILQAIPRFDTENQGVSEPLMQIRVDFPPEPPEILRTTEAGTSRAAAKVWIDQWRAFTERMRDELHHGRSAARVIVDEEHTRLIETVLATTQNRLIVISDNISAEVVTKEFLARALRLCQSNVHVRFVFRRFMGEEKTASHIKEILEDASSQSDGRFSWVQVNTHAKVIIADDSAVVTSFNPLSFAGAFPEQWVALGRRQSSELGVLCTGSDTADSIIGALEKTCPAAVAEFNPSVVVAPASEVIIDQVVEDLPKMVVSALAASGTAEVPLKDVFGMADRPWELLEKVASGLESKALRKTISTCMAVTGETGDERWVKCLAQTAWHLMDPFETALLLASLPDEQAENTPSLSALLVSIALSDPEAIDVVGTVLNNIQNRTESDSALIALLALVALLGRGQAAGFDLLVHGTLLSDPWPTALNEVEAYWTETYEPFPVSHFRLQHEQLETTESAEAAWSRLQKKFDEASSEHFKFPEGTKIWAHLFHANGCFGKLREAIVNQNAAAARAWLRAAPVNDLNALLLNTAVEVHGSEKFAIAGRKKDACIEALSEMIEALHELIGLIPSSSTLDPNWFIERASILRESLAAVWTDLGKTATGIVSSDSLPIANRALDYLGAILSLD